MENNTAREAEKMGETLAQYQQTNVPLYGERSQENTYRNIHFTKRDYEWTNLVACVGENAPDANWEACGPEVLKGLTQLHIERGIRYYGYL